MIKYYLHVVSEQGKKCKWSGEGRLFKGKNGNLRSPFPNSNLVSYGALLQVLCLPLSQVKMVEAWSSLLFGGATTLESCENYFSLSHGFSMRAQNISVLIGIWLLSGYVLSVSLIYSCISDYEVMIDTVITWLPPWTHIWILDPLTWYAIFLLYFSPCNFF